MDINILAKIYNSVGVIFDIIGAFFVASEVVKTYKGLQFSPYMFNDVGKPPQKTSEYKNWEKRKYEHMKIGLVSLTFGFFMQLISNWVLHIFDFFSRVPQ